MINPNESIEDVGRRIRSGFVTGSELFAWIQAVRIHGPTLSEQIACGARIDPLWCRWEDIDRGRFEVEASLLKQLQELICGASTIGDERLRERLTEMSLLLPCYDNSRYSTSAGGEPCGYF